jgi:quinolinate synthase
MITDMYKHLKERIGDIMPDAEIRTQAKIAEEIMILKKEQNAIILGHNYMDAALFNSVPDFVGDSLELSRKAAETNADVIIFCGVKFMAETAKILSPNKKVLIPTAKGGCSLAEGITAKDIKALRKRFPNTPVVTYINTYADIKAEVDICCTSGNAKAVIESLDNEKVIFVPDRHLASNIAKECEKRIIFPEDFPKLDSGEITENDYDMIGWSASCEVHELFTPKDIAEVRKQFPDVAVIAHPECPTTVCDAADFTGSTSAMISYVQNSPAKRFLLMTECAMGDNIAAIVHNQGKEVLRLCSQRCKHMGEVTLQDVLDTLKKNQYQTEVPKEIQEKALKSVQRMLDIKASGAFTKKF